MTRLSSWADPVGEFSAPLRPIGRTRPRAINRACLVAILLGCTCLSAATLIAQSNKTDSQTVDDSTFGAGGKKTTEYADHEGKHFVDTTYQDPKGNVLKKTSEMSYDNGTVRELEEYADGKTTYKLRQEFDKSGKLLRSQSEYYVGGVISDGFRKEHLSATYEWITHRFNPQSGKWEEVVTKTASGISQPEERLTMARLNLEGKLKTDMAGTGETIGHVADLKVQNLTDQPLTFVVAPMVSESKNGKNQDYACPYQQEVALAARETKNIPLDGVCLARDKQPVGKGVGGDLVVNDGDRSTPNFESHLTPDQSRELLRIIASKYQAADKLEEDGAFKDFPYREKQKQHDIVVQWSTWSDPRVAQITGNPPATKEDLKQVAYKQSGSPRGDKKKKIDQGIDTIFDKIELTSAKAKDLEQPPPEQNPATERPVASPPPATF